MIRTILAAITLTAGQAMAHPGHIAPEAGHDHGALISLALIAGLAFAGLAWARFTRR